MKNKQTDSSQPVKLATINTQFESDMLLALLEDSNIPAYRQHQGSGSYMAIYMGYSVFGSDIYVNASDYEKAKGLMALLENDAEGFDNYGVPVSDENEDTFAEPDGREYSDSGKPLTKKDDPRYRFTVLFVRILLVFILVPMVLSAISVLYMFFSLL